MFCRKHKEESKTLEKTIDAIFKECKMNHKFFSFFEIPDFLMKKQLNQKDLDNTIELLNIVKQEYLRGKAEALSKQVEEVKMSEDDLVPLAILTDMFALRKQKIESKHNFVIDYLKTL